MFACTKKNRSSLVICSSFLATPVVGQEHVPANWTKLQKSQNEILRGLGTKTDLLLSLSSLSWDMKESVLPAWLKQVVPTWVLIQNWCDVQWMWRIFLVPKRLKIGCAGVAHNKLHNDMSYAHIWPTHIKQGKPCCTHSLNWKWPIAIIDISHIW